MPKFQYVAMDSHGKETKGVLEVSSQAEAINRLREMGFFPTKVVEVEKPKKKAAAPRGGPKQKKSLKEIELRIPFLSGRVNTKVLTTFTRQLATLVDAGLPLLRGLRVLEKQEKNPTLKRVIGELATAIEGGSTLSEALAQHPKIFNRLFINMVRAGEIGGVLEVVLNRLAEFMEKAQRIRGKVKSAMFYPAAVITVAIVILGVLMVFVVPRFQQIFADMLEGQSLPAFTQLVLSIANTVRSKTIITIDGPPYVLPGPVIWGIVAFVVAFRLLLKTNFFRHLWDRFKLINSGVPILQALTIVRETSGNVIVADAVAKVHEAVKEGESITKPLEASKVFPPMVISMVDVGEQTGALPEMLLKIADTYDEEVDNAVSAMTSLLEPILIVFLAVIVGSIVIAMFLPLITLMNQLSSSTGS